MLKTISVRQKEEFYEKNIYNNFNVNIREIIKDREWLQKQFFLVHKYIINCYFISIF